MIGDVDKTKKTNTVKKLSNVIYKLRFILLGIAVCILLFLFGYIFLTNINNDRTSKGTLVIENIQKDYDQWLLNDNDEEKKQKAEKILSDLDEVITGYCGLYPELRALMIKGNLYYEEKDWDSSIAAYSKIVKKFPKKYMAPLALMKISSAYEEKKDIDTAIEQYTRLYEDYNHSFPDTPRVLFSIGRLYEEKKDIDSAIKAYEKIENLTDNDWTKLAASRIIELKRK